MQQVKIGSTVDLGIGKAKVVGMLKFHTFTEYLVKMNLNQNSQYFWLEQGREWRLWRKIKPPFKAGALLTVLKESWDKRYLLGEALAGLNWLTVQEVGFAQVLEAAGETEDTGPGDKMVYVEGYFQERSAWEFNLFVAEAWNGEVECYEGRIVNI